MKNNILSNIQKGITVVTVAGAACYGSAEASLTQTSVNTRTVFDGLTGVADDANVPGPYKSYYITEDMVEDVKAATGDSTVAASGYLNATQTIQTQKQFDSIRNSNLTTVQTLEGSTQMYVYTATNFDLSASTYVAGELTLGYNFSDKAFYDQFVSDYETHGVVFQLPGIDYLAADTKVFIDVSFTDSNGVVTKWQGGEFLVGTTTQVFTMTGGQTSINALYIPEPSTATLSLLSLAGLLVRRRRKTA